MATFTLLGTWTVTLGADMDGDVVGECWRCGCTTVDVDIGGRWGKWMVMRVGDRDGDAGGKTQRERCL